MNFIEKIINKIWKKVYIKDLEDFLQIDDIGYIGFTVKNLRNKPIKKYLWQNISKIDINEDKDTLIFTDKNGTISQISNKIHGWYKMLKNIPKQLKQPIENDIKNIFDNLEFCPICGYKSVNDDSCAVCGSSKRNETDIEERNKLIKISQLEAFSIYHITEKINFKKYDNDIFQKDPKYKIIVTEKEILDYSKIVYMASPKKNIT